jgi:hypothetical protein
LNEGLARGGVDQTQVADIGQTDEDRIAPLDVSGLLARTGVREGEEHGVTDRKDLAGRQGHDRPATATALDVRDPLFVRRIRVHRGSGTVAGVTIGTVVITRTAVSSPPDMRDHR